MPELETIELETDFHGDGPALVVRLLDENTANRIAAGEVIERPSSVVKELVENAIDAGATRIEVELRDGGKNGIVVRDNGSGMHRNDAIVALQRHATSKIRSADDLFSIRTLGFRGEALPSIASVSDFTILTKRAGDESATRLVVRGGDLVSVRDAAGPDGTTITVENLFFNVPARLKFLKTTQTELNHSVDLIHRLVLAYHAKAFRLTHDGYEMVGYPGANDARHALAAVWGRDHAREMVPLTYDSPAIAVRGWVSKPSLSKASRSAQAMFVNGRFVRSRTLQHAFDSAFRHLMTTDRFPVVALFLDIAPELVDVNVHPAKTEVRFTRDGDVYHAVHNAVQDALLTGGLVPEVAVQASLPAGLALPVGSRPVPERLIPPKVALSSWGQDAVTLPWQEQAPIPNPSFLNWGRGPEEIAAFQDAIVSANPSHSFAPFRGEELGIEASPSLAPESYIGFDGHRIGRLRVLGQSRNTYIVAETDDALLLIDQHIAHERVLYEQLMNRADGSDGAVGWGMAVQHLALPQTVQFSARDARIVQERQDALSRAGFLLETFGGDTFVLRTVPATVADKPYVEILREIVDEIAEVSLSRRLLIPHEAALIMASCKMAVKKGDPLTMDEMNRLLTDLATMKNPFTCPHGRPILLSLPHREMDRKFHRIGPH